MTEIIVLLSTPINELRGSRRRHFTKEALENIGRLNNVWNNNLIVF